MSFTEDRMQQKDQPESKDQTASTDLRESMISVCASPLPIDRCRVGGELVPRSIPNWPV